MVSLPQPILRARHLLAAVPLFGLATGALFPLVALNLAAMEVSSSFIGSVTSLYYAGSFLGAVSFGFVVRRLGYRRGFAVAALIAALATYALTLTDNPSLWLLLRFAGGYALGAYYIVVDSWFQALGRRDTRGKLFAVYETLRLAATALGPFLLVLGAIESNLVLIALAYLLSIAPASFNEPPKGGAAKEFSFSGMTDLARCFPFALIVGFCGGAANASFYGLSAVYAAQVNFDRAEIAFFVAFVLVAPAISQIPLGAGADRSKRMTLALGCAITALLACISMAALAQPSLWMACLGGALVGGCLVPLYAFGLSRIVDTVGEDDAVSAATVVLLAYNLGAFVAPAGAGLAMDALGSGGLYLFLGAIALLALVAAKSDAVFSNCCPESSR